MGNARDKTIKALLDHGFVASDSSLGEYQLTLEDQQKYKYRGLVRTRNVWSAAYVSVDDGGLLSGFSQSSNALSSKFDGITFEKWKSAT